jgi:hypothetical protein
MQRSGGLLRTLVAVVRDIKATEHSAWGCGSRAAATSAQDGAAGMPADLCPRSKADGMSIPGISPHNQHL